MPGAQEVRHLVDAFGAVSWWTLRPDPPCCGRSRVQTGGDSDVSAWIAARSERGDLAVLYLPQGGTVALDAGRLAPGLRLTWVNPETARAWRGRSASRGPAAGAGRAGLAAHLALTVSQAGAPP